MNFNWKLLLKLIKELLIFGGDTCDWIVLFLQLRSGISPLANRNKRSFKIFLIAALIWRHSDVAPSFESRNSNFRWIRIHSALLCIFTYFGTVAQKVNKADDDRSNSCLILSLVNPYENLSRDLSCYFSDVWKSQQFRTDKNMLRSRDNIMRILRC